jgi:hypothetical protein
VWGGYLMTDYGQRRVIVATFTKSKARRLLNLSYSNFENYWCEIGNVLEVAIAARQPEVLFIQKDPHVKYFERL